MPTTVVQAADRTYGGEGYAERLRRPVWLEGLGAASTCPAGFTYRKSGGRCFCDPILQGLGGLGEEIPCPLTVATTAYRTPITQKAAVLYRPSTVPTRLPSVVTARAEAQKVAIVYKAPAVDVSPGPAVPEPLPEEGASVAPPVVLPVTKKTSPWVYASAGGAALVVFWLFFKKKQ